MVHAGALLRLRGAEMLRRGADRSFQRLLVVRPAEFRTVFLPAFTEANKKRAAPFQMLLLVRPGGFEPLAFGVGEL